MIDLLASAGTSGVMLTETVKEVGSPFSSFLMFQLPLGDPLCSVSHWKKWTGGQLVRELG